MKMSNHAKERAAQRLCRTADLNLALEYGNLGNHGILVTKDSVLQAEREVFEAQQKAQRLRRMLGIYAPIGDDGAIITIQRVNRQKQKRILRSELFA